MRWRRLAAVILGLFVLDGLNRILRPLHDRWGAEADLDRVMPGDDLAVHSDAVITRAIEIDAPPERVWPWLVQLGFGRAGWYSVDVVDNLGRESSWEILPEWQRTPQPSDIIPSGPFGAGFPVIEAVPNEYLLLRTPNIGGTGTWSFVLVPLEGGRTRLVERLRGRSEWWAPLRWLAAFADALDAVMMIQHLRGLKARAERGERTLPRAEVGAPPFA